MSDTNTVRGTNFTCYHAGAKEGWGKFHLEPPLVPLSLKGKQFVRSEIGSTGLEMSLNVVPPGKGIPFLHKHRENDEVYYVVGGKGQFIVDGEVIDVSEGSVLRISPSAPRAWRNNSTEPMYFLCIQYRADSVVTGGTSDGVGVEEKLKWPS